MPLYEYKCGQCGSVFEVLQKIKDKPLTVHEGCGGTLERLLSTPAFQFKGSGFYITDYKKGSNGSSSTTPKKESKETPAATPPPKTESTSASKTEPAKS